MNPQEVFINLKIMDLAKQWPEFRALHDMARAELAEANEAAQEELTARAKAVAAIEAKRLADVAARQKADRERETAQAAQARPRVIPGETQSAPAPAPQPSPTPRRDV